MSIPTRLLPQTATVKYKAIVADGYGGQVTTLTTRRTGYRCRIYQHKSQEPIRQANGDEAMSTHKLIGEPLEIHAGDIITVNDADYEILGPDWKACQVYDSGNPHHNEVFLRAL